VVLSALWREHWQCALAMSALHPHEKVDVERDLDKQSFFVHLEHYVEKGGIRRHWND
jgi:hypothetical protein